MAESYNIYDIAEKILAAIQQERDGMTHMNIMIMPLCTMKVLNVLSISSLHS